MDNILTDSIKDQTARALWEVKNVIDCVPEKLWCKEYCNAPMWQHIYHMLHSLDVWYINPNDANYEEPEIHCDNLNNLDITPDDSIILTRAEINEYYRKIKNKINSYLNELSDDKLCNKPQGCDYNKFTLIMAQFRHLHSHMGMIMGFIIDDVGLWPRVLGLQRPIPTDDNYEKFC